MAPHNKQYNSDLMANKNGLVFLYNQQASFISQIFYEHWHAINWKRLKCKQFLL